MEKLIKFITRKEVVGPVVILILGFITYYIVSALINKLVKKGKSSFEIKKRNTVIELLKNLFKYVLIAVCLIIVLDIYGVNVSSIVASLGIVSAVGALSLQDTLKDIINGSNIILDNYFVVGDTVTYNNFTGKVIQLGLRTTKIQNVDGKVLTISNRNISEVINLSQKTSSVLIEIPTAYEEKTEKVEKVIEQIVEEIKTWDTVNIDDTAYIGITSLADSCVMYGIRIYSSPGKIWEYKRQALRLAKIKYEQNKIKIPYNQLEVHNAK